MVLKLHLFGMLASLLVSTTLAFRVKSQFLSKAITTMNVNTNNEKYESHTTNHEVSDPTDQKLMLKLKEHNENAIKPTMAEDVRTLIEHSIHYGVLSTNSLQYPGYPTGSIVGFELDEFSKPFFVFSSMSAHTKDIKHDGRVSLTITANNFKGAADGRVVIIGEIQSVDETDNRKETLREMYKARHKDAYWIDFGDFHYFSMNTITAVRYVGGFALAGSVTPHDFLNARPDPCAVYAEGVITHMNSDHRDSLVDMVKFYTGIDCIEAHMVHLDRLGFTVHAKMPIEGVTVHKVRLPFTRVINERKDVKLAIMEMADAAASSEKVTSSSDYKSEL